MPRQLPVLACGLLAALFASPPSIAADAGHGKILAKRWCASCHVVEPDQHSATDQAPPFASIAGMSDFNDNKLAFLLLKPHPNMPRLSLSRTEAADLADYMRSLR
jgi:mono/diheme cytochrome c family protein